MDGWMDRWMLFSKLQSQSILLPRAFLFSNSAHPSCASYTVGLGEDRLRAMFLTRFPNVGNKYIYVYICIYLYIYK